MHVGADSTQPHLGFTPWIEAVIEHSLPNSPMVLAGFIRDSPFRRIMSNSSPVQIGILTASDRAASGEYEDLSGPEIEAFLDEVLSSPTTFQRKLVPDNIDDISDALMHLSDDLGSNASKHPICHRCCPGRVSVSYTHLTLPTTIEV